MKLAQLHFKKKPERSQAGDVNVVRAAAISTPGLSMTANVSDLLTNRDKKKIGDREDIFKTLLRELNLAEISKTIKKIKLFLILFRKRRIGGINMIFYSPSLMIWIWRAIYFPILIGFTATLR